MLRKFILTLAFLIAGIMLTAQVNRTLQDIFIEAEYFFMNEDYPDALPYYLQLYEKVPGNSNIAFRIGACYLNIDGKKNLSIDFLEVATKNLSARQVEGSITQTAAPYDALYDLGRAYLINYQFDKASETFTRYKGTLLPDDRANIDFINKNIESCETAKELLNKPVTFVAENLGKPVSTEESEFYPVISSDGKSLAFMVSEKFYDAIMFSSLVNDKWSTPVNITPELESDGDMYISCLASDGNTLYLSKDDNLNSDIFISKFDGIRWGRTIKLNKNINTRYWESHGFVSSNGNQLIFASDRPGGFGGLDLYISTMVNGEWGPAVNLGPQVNTQFNEDRPFLVNNGKTLYFCSQGHLNMGGHDIFRSELQSNNLWSKPQNLGYPVNTPDDNVFFMPIGNGKTGYYSIFKESGGYGNEDIYRITFK